MQEASSLGKIEHRYVESKGKPTRDAASRVNDSIHSLVRNYFALIKLYAQDGSGTVAKAIAMTVVGGICLLMGWIMFVVATIFLLAPVLPIWASIGAWALIHVAVGLYALAKIRSEARQIRVEPKTEPIEPLKMAEKDPLFYGGGFVP